MKTIANCDRVKLSRVKRIIGRENVGVMFDVKLDNLKVADFADYGDGGGPTINFKPALWDFIKGDEQEIANEHYGKSDADVDGSGISFWADRIEKCLGKLKSDDNDVQRQGKYFFIEAWMEEQIIIYEDIKDCKKGIVIIDKLKPHQKTIFKMPFTQANKKSILDMREYRDRKSDITILNEKCGLIPTPREAFLLEYKKRIADIKKGHVYFRVLDHDAAGGFESKQPWRVTVNPLSKERAEAFLLGISGKNQGRDVEVLSRMIDEKLAEFDSPNTMGMR